MSASWVDRLQASELGRQELDRQRVLLQATETICVLMELQDVSRSELARRLGKAPSFITKLLRGTNNFTLTTLADIMRVLDRSLNIEVGPREEAVRLPSGLKANSIRLDSDWGREGRCLFPAAPAMVRKVESHEAANSNYGMAA